MNNLRILLYVIALSLAACHPEGTNVNQGLDKAAQLIEQDPDTASFILENIRANQMNEAQLAEYNLLCTQFNEDKNIPHSSDEQIRQAVSYFVAACIIRNTATSTKHWKWKEKPMPVN